ncbi:NAD(P)(+) transhydrogenase (Re/Si-specific) subunit beta [Listeria weihenstephanensis]|uniref:NAD(P)(+) transhydrogenase (Re/Si-specific) subunit beta n=1 Tax=Listeria weihenstephanensis TaxID=1006155 RepID=A0A1S7FTZ6_9LIST|nr:hypothetical protein [Listeria weihenstephanensis]AQY50837.1 hypothetical protein UE46_07135 [Listeria weihenstephanensis]MBC1501930.1 NAD(P)(+) transhydrogenase (Re/Si-specific) subunit beta [Listeria weihenstephanensis]
MNQTEEVVARFHVLGYFLISFLFIGAGITLSASGVSSGMIATLLSFSKYVLLLLIVGVIGVWRSKERSSRYFFGWFIVIPFAYAVFLIIVILTRAHL